MVPLGWLDRKTSTQTNMNAWWGNWTITGLEEAPTVGYEPSPMIVHSRYLSKEQLPRAFQSSAESLKKQSWALYYLCCLLTACQTAWNRAYGSSQMIVSCTGISRTSKTAPYSKRISTSLQHGKGNGAWLSTQTSAVRSGSQDQETQLSWTTFSKVIS